MDLETLAIVQLENLPTGGKTSVKSIKTIGTLELLQRSPIHNSRTKRTLYNDDLFNYLQSETLSTFLGQRYYNRQRNETTNYLHETFVQRGISGSTNDFYVDISIIINIPREQQILYAPDVWEVLKFAWI